MATPNPSSNPDRNQFRSIVPKELVPAPSASTSTAQSVALTEVILRRPKSVKVACLSCRSRRIKCDGERPQCRQCWKIETSCIYETKDASETRWNALKRESDTLKKSLDHLQQLISQFRTLPIEAAQTLLQNMRAAPDDSFPLRLPRQTRLEDRMDAELFIGTWRVKHSLVHVQFDRHEEESLLRNLLRHRSKSAGRLSRRLNALKTSPFVPGMQDAQNQPQTTLFTNDNMSDGSFSNVASPHIQMPSSLNGAEAVISRRLAAIDFQRWTRVPLSNDHCRAAIHLYFKIQHAFLGMFHIDSVLDNLRDGDSHFCSPFFVNALLAFSMQAYTFQWKPAAQESYKFEDAAVQLEKSVLVDSIPAVLGLAFLKMSLQHHGEGDQAGDLLEKMIAMAHRLRLLGVEDSLTLQDISHMPLRAQQAVSYAAWGVFSFLTIQSTVGMTAILQSPPKLPIPGCEKIKLSPLSGLSNSTITWTADPILTAFCKLCNIIAQNHSNQRNTEKDQPVNLGFALNLHQQLMSMLDSMPGDSIRQIEHTSAPSMIFLIWLHTFCLDLTRPFTPFTAPNQTAVHSLLRQIHTESLTQLKQIFLTVLTRHPAVRYSICWHLCPLYVANAALRGTSTPSWRLYFELAIRAYRDYYFVRPSLQVMEGVTKGLLVMAVDLGAMMDFEALNLWQTSLQDLEQQGRSITAETSIDSSDGSSPGGGVLNNDGVDAIPGSGGGEWGRPKKSLGGFVIDLEGQGDAAKVNSLADRFDEMMVFDEVTNT